MSTQPTNNDPGTDGADLAPANTITAAAAPGAVADGVIVQDLRGTRAKALQSTRVPLPGQTVAIIDEGIQLTGDGIRTVPQLLARDDAERLTRPAAEIAFKRVPLRPSGGSDRAPLQALIDKIGAGGILELPDSTFIVDSTITLPRGFKLVTNLRSVTDDIDILGLRSMGVFVGKITGTSHVAPDTAHPSTGRAIFAAEDGAADCYVDVDLEELPLGVCLKPVTPGGAMPARWRGNIRARNITGLRNASEGYTLLCSPARDCRFRVEGVNMARHMIYLSAGSTGNVITGKADQVRHAPVQLAAYPNQAVVRGNHVTIEATGIVNDTLPRTTYAANCYGGVQGNTLVVKVSGSDCDGAVLFRSYNSALGIAVCRDNTAEVYAEGNFRDDIVSSDAGLDNYVSRLTGFGSPGDATRGLVAARPYNGIVHTVTDYKNSLKVGVLDWNANGAAVHAAVCTTTDGWLDIQRDAMSVRNSTAPEVFINTGAKLRGASRTILAGPVSTGPIDPGKEGIAVFTWDPAGMNATRHATVSIVLVGVTNTATAPDWALVSLTDTGARVAVKNNAAVTAAATVTLRLEGRGL